MYNVLINGTHVEDAPIVSYYMMEGNKTIGLHYSNFKKELLEVYFYSKSLKDGHDYSRAYEYEKIPTKYKAIAEKMKNNFKNVYQLPTLEEVLKGH
jgi:hypothetical protein